MACSIKDNGTTLNQQGINNLLSRFAGNQQAMDSIIYDNLNRMMYEEGEEYSKARDFVMNSFNMSALEIGAAHRREFNRLHRVKAKPNDATTIGALINSDSGNAPSMLGSFWGNVHKLFTSYGAFYDYRGTQEGRNASAASKRVRDYVELHAKKIKENINDAEYKELDDPYIARNFLYEYLPRTMKTKVLDEFDTIANIIRHTQKKPRQVIYLVNTILTIAKNNGFSFKSIDEGTINDGIHARLDVPVKSTTDMYSLIYQKCLDITNAVLVDKNNIMSMSELDSFLKSAHNIAGKSVFPYEIKRMLFEIGAIGTVRKRMNYKENKQIVEVLYEYQIKNMLPYNEQSVIAVHPMFYTRLHIKVSNTEFIYPVPGEEVETTILKELNITLI